MIVFFFFFSSRRRHTRFDCDWSSDVCSSDLLTWAMGDLGCPDRLDVLALPEANFDALMPSLRALPWDILILGNLAASAPNATRLARALARDGCAVRWNELWPCPY